MTSDRALITGVAVVADVSVIAQIANGWVFPPNVIVAAIATFAAVLCWISKEKRW